MGVLGVSSTHEDAMVETNDQCSHHDVQNGLSSDMPEVKTSFVQTFPSSVAGKNLFHML
ncbi:MAG: hypothetical protein ACI9H6_000606, partial [Patiriisocius sp.]